MLCGAGGDTVFAFGFAGPDPRLEADVAASGATPELGLVEIGRIGGNKLGPSVTVIAVVSSTGLTDGLTV